MASAAAVLRAASGAWADATSAEHGSRHAPGIFQCGAVYAADSLGPGLQPQPLAVLGELRFGVSGQAAERGPNADRQPGADRPGGQDRQPARRWKSRCR